MIHQSCREDVKSCSVGVSFIVLTALLCPFQRIHAEDLSAERMYDNRLTPITDPLPLLADHPEFVEPILERRYYESSVLVDDERPDLFVRAWRFSCNARGVIEMPNRLQSSRTAVIVVHPWGINDGQGWRVPEPAGFAFGTPAKNRFYARHLTEVVNPFLNSLRSQMALVMYSLRGGEDPIRQKLYRSIRWRPTAKQREQGRRELSAKLSGFNYQAGAVPERFAISRKRSVADYFRRFPGGAHRDHFNGAGYWELPVPVHNAIDLDADDVVIYDDDGYGPLRDFLKDQGIKHILLAGYATSKCYCSTTAGYQNLERDFNVFLVGDATLESPAVNRTPRFATSAVLAEASREHLITQISWIRKQNSRIIRSGATGSTAINRGNREK
jgi:hypothetical protein